MVEISHHYEFKNHDDVSRHIALRESKTGGALAYMELWGEVTIYRADSPSQLPDFLIGITGGPRDSAGESILYYKGEWRRFSKAATARESKRGIWSNS